MKRTEPLKIDLKLIISRLKYHIILAGLIIFGFACSIITNITVTSLFEQNFGPVYTYFWGIADGDQWFDYAFAFKFALLHNGAGFAAFTALYHHTFTPLFPACLAIIDLVFNNILVSDFILNGLLTIGTVFILKKTFVSILHLEEKDAMLGLILYQSNFIILNNTLVGNESMPFVAFCVVLALYTSAKFVETVNLENGIKVFIANTLVMYSREIIWPILFLAPAIILIRVVIKQNGVQFRFFDFIKKEVKAIYFATILPSICYLVFFLFVNAIPSILTQLYMLNSFVNVRTVPTFFFNAFLAFSFMPVLILFDIKGVFKKAESLPFLIWIGIFILARLIMPGAFWATFFEPAIFCFCALSIQSLREGKLESWAKFLLPILVIENFAIQIIAYVFPIPFIVLYYG